MFTIDQTLRNLNADPAVIVCYSSARPPAICTVISNEFITVSCINKDAAFLMRACRGKF